MCSNSSGRVSSSIKSHSGSIDENMSVQCGLGALAVSKTEDCSTFSLMGSAVSSAKALGLSSSLAEALEHSTSLAKVPKLSSSLELSIEIFDVEEHDSVDQSKETLGSSDAKYSLSFDNFVLRTLRTFETGWGIVSKLTE